MAQSSQKNLELKREIVLKLDASRKRIADESMGLNQRMRPANLVSSYLRSHPLFSFGATSIGVAALTYLLFPRPRTPAAQTPQSLSQSLLGWIPSFLKGSIRNWIFRQARDYLLTKRP